MKMDKRMERAYKRICFHGRGIVARWLDRVFGYHETEVILNSMLDKEYHDKFRQRAYRPLRQGYIKDFSSISGAEHKMVVD